MDEVASKGHIMGSINLNSDNKTFKWNNEDNKADNVINYTDIHDQGV